MSTNSLKPRRTGGVPTRESDSFLVQVFLFVVVVILPLGILFHSWSLALQEQKLRGLADVHATLEDAAHQAERQISPSAALSQAILVPLSSPQKFLTLARNLERRYPGAFRWQAWDESGKLLQLPKGITLGSTRLWQDVASQFFLFSETLHTRIESQRTTGTTLQRLQSFLGPNLTAEVFLKSGGRAITFTWLGKNTIAAWIDFLPTRKGATKSLNPPATDGVVSAKRLDGAAFADPSFNPAGLLCLLDPAKITVDAPIRMQCLNSRSGPCFMGVINGDSREGDYLQPGLPKHASFLRSIKKALRTEPDGFFQIKTWMGRFLPIPGSNDHRLAIFTPVGKILRQYNKNFREAFILVLWGAVMALGLMVAINLGLLSNLSLSGRIAALFILSMLLPASGLLHFFNALITKERDQMRSRMQERFRQVAAELKTRFSSFGRRYGKVLYKHLEKKMVTATTEADLQKCLDQLIGSGLISRYFLSDGRGELARMNSITKMDKDSLNFLRILLRMTFRDNIGFSQGPTLTDVVVDQAASLGKPGETQTLRLTRPTELHRHTFGSFNRNIMYVVPRLENSMRVLLIEVEDQILARSAAFSELKRNRYATKSDTEIPVELHFNIAHGSLNLPKESPLWKISRIWTSIQQEFETTGEITIEKEKFLFHIPAGARDSPFQPVLISSLRPIAARLAERQREFAFGLLLAIGAALLLGMALANRLLGPIRLLDHSMSRVGKGELQITLPSFGNDEISRMGESFNVMVQKLREKERMRAYLSENVLEAVQKDETTSNAGEIIEATILFSDIRSFTTLCESQKPEAVFRMLNDFFSGVERVIHHHEGRIDKFIGDAVMAVFLGEPKTQAQNAVFAAYAINQFLRRLNSKRKSEGLFQIAIGIGISTGKVMFGDVGSARRKDLTVIGDEVNLAARLESASKDGTCTHIILAEHTRNLLNGLAETRRLPQETVKGKTKTIRMYELVRLNTSTPSSVKPGAPIDQDDPDFFSPLLPQNETGGS